jgi:hypothetical protein
VKRLAGFVIAVAILFAGVTFLKSRSSDTQGSLDSVSMSDEDRDRIRRFWEVYRLATDHRIAGRSAEAAEQYRGALTLNPEHQDALYYLGNMQLALGDLTAAEQAWQRLLEIDPTSARAHSQLGTLYFCVGEEEPLQPEKAAAEFQRALAIYTEETGPLLHLGEIALVQGHLENARYYFDAVIGSNFSSVEAHFYEGYIEWTTGDRAQAAELLAAAIRFAEPPEPVEGVLGEGDTREGAAPMVSTPVRCEGMQTLVGELVESDGGVARQVEPVYRKFDEFLEEVRGQLPR